MCKLEAICVATGELSPTPSPTLARPLLLNGATKGALAVKPLFARSHPSELTQIESVSAIEARRVINANALDTSSCSGVAALFSVRNILAVHSLYVTRV